MIFILGGRGFIGSAFVRACAAAGRAYTILDRNNYTACVGQACEIFVNANGNSKKFLSQREPVSDFDASVRSVRACLEDFQSDCYVHLSSCDVYADCSSPYTTREDQVFDVAQQSPYGFHKYLAEQCVQHVGKRWLIARLGGFVGPGLKKNAIFDILNGGPLWLDPDSQLQFMETDQAAKIILQLVDQGKTQEIFNLCGRGVVRLRDVIDHVGHAVPVSPHSPRVRYDVSIEKVSGWVDVPETRQAVFAFVETQLAERNELEQRSKEAGSL